MSFKVINKKKYTITKGFYKALAFFVVLFFDVTKRLLMREKKSILFGEAIASLQIRLVQKKMRVVISVRRYKKRKLGIEDNHRVTSEVAQ